MKKLVLVLGVITMALSSCKKDNESALKEAIQKVKQEQENVLLECKEKIKAKEQEVFSSELNSMIEELEQLNN